MTVWDAANNIAVARDEFQGQGRMHFRAMLAAGPQVPVYPAPGITPSTPDGTPSLVLPQVDANFSDDRSAAACECVSRSHIFFSCLFLV